MIVLLLCIGYTYNDIMMIFLKINLDKFYDISDIFDFLNIYEFNKFRSIRKTYKSFIKKVNLKKYITFNELYNLTKNLNIFLLI